LGTFNSKLACLFDFCGVRTKVCRIFSTISSATHGRPWPYLLSDTQLLSTNGFYPAKIVIIWRDF
jgi:hypothetical protein